MGVGIKALVGFGIGFIVAGLIYSFLEDVFNRYILQYVVNTNDPYYRAEALGWDVIPYVLLFVGIICLIVAGLGSRSVKESG